MALTAKAAITVLTNEKARKTAGWVIVAILSPVIVVVALICSIFSGAAQQNVSTVELCFHGGTIPANASAEYRTYVTEMQASFSELDAAVGEINAGFEGKKALTLIRSRPFFMFCISAPPSHLKKIFKRLRTAL